MPARTIQGRVGAHNVSDEPPRASGRRVTLAVLARALDARPTGRGQVARELMLALHRIRPDIQLHVFAASDPGLGGDITFHPASAPSRMGAAWRFVAGIGRELEQLRPDAIWSPTHVLPLLLPRHIPTVITLLDLVWRDQPQTMDKWHRRIAALGERSIRRADAIVCISEFTRSRLLHYWPDAETRTHVMHLAPASSLATGLPGRRVNVERPVIASVGTIEPRKNFGVLFEAMASLPDFVLQHYGSVGWQVEELIARARLLPNVQLSGYGDAAAVANLYRSAAVAVFPSIYEGFDLPPLEAMALGCPVIASDIPVHREVLGDAAVYIEPTAPALIKTLRWLARDSAELDRRSEAGRFRAASYSWDSAARRLLSVIETIVTAPARTTD